MSRAVPAAAAGLSIHPYVEVAGGPLERVLADFSFERNSVG